MIESVSNMLRKSESLPFLFIGSGISRRYLNMPDWEGLLNKLSNMIGENAFLKYSNRSKTVLKSGYTHSEQMSIIADFIEYDLNDIWYDKIEFEESRKLYEEDFKNGVTPLKIEISRYAKEISSDENNFLLKDEIESMRKISDKSISGIITTNYDNFLENIFKFDKYIGQEELMFSNNYGLSEIYKIHGCCSKPESIVINSNDYDRFNKTNQYLAAKLLTIFVENPIIFMGYSVNDDNIKNILKSLIICSGNKITSIEDKFIFVERNDKIETYKESEYTIDFTDIYKSIHMKKIELNDFSLLYETLAVNRSKYPVKTLRRIKKDIYDLILTNDKNNKLAVLAEDNVFGDDNKDIEYVVGVGVLDIGKRGYKFINQFEIFEDIILDNGNFNNKILVEQTIDFLLPFTGGSLPFYKYIKDLNYDNLSYKLKKYINKDYDDFKSSDMKVKKVSEKSISEITTNSEYSLHKKLYLISCLKQEKINMEELEKFLYDMFTDKNMFLEEEFPYIKKGTGKSNLRRLIRMYDWLKYYKK